MFTQDTVLILKTAGMHLLFGFSLPFFRNVLLGCRAFACNCRLLTTADNCWLVLRTPACALCSLAGEQVQVPAYHSSMSLSRSTWKQYYILHSWFLIVFIWYTVTICILETKRNQDEPYHDCNVELCVLEEYTFPLLTLIIAPFTFSEGACRSSVENWSVEKQLREHSFCPKCSIWSKKCLCLKGCSKFGTFLCFTQTQRRLVTLICCIRDSVFLLLIGTTTWLVTHELWAEETKDIVRLNSELRVLLVLLYNVEHGKWNPLDIKMSLAGLVHSNGGT